MRRLCAAAAAVFCVASTAFAQNYNQAVVFGDSTADAGWFAHAQALPGITNPFDTAIAAALAAGGNAHFTGPGPNNSQILAGFFGTTANSANAPGGGTNYAIGGAFVSNSLGYTNLTNLQLSGPPYNSPINPELPSTTGQIAEYLNAVQGHANPNALYLISTGGNDIFAIAGGAVPSTFISTYINSEAQSLATSVQTLQNAGARYIIVADNYVTAGIAALPAIEANALIAYGTQLQTTIWHDLAAEGVKFIPADTDAVINAVRANYQAYGFTDITNPACVGTQANVTSAACTTSQLVTANALQTHLYVDDTHLTEAGQIIIADYYYSLLTAPSEISFLAENAVKTRLTLVSSIQNQIETSDGHRGPNGVNAWVSGDVNSISFDNYHDFPNDPGTLWTGSAGVDIAVAPGIIGGVAVSGGTINASLGQGTFKQTEGTVSLYAAYNQGPIWGTAIGTYGHLDYNVNRVVPIGITLQSNNGSTSGDNWSGAFQGGYKFWTDGITHGPVLGFIYQDVNVGGFTESGSYTSLSFGSQNRESDVGQWGYRASIDLPGYGYFASITPFIQATYNHDFANPNRLVTASLTTIAAPSFSLPAVILGQDWGEIKGGLTFDLGGGAKFLAIGSAEVGQNSATVYGLQIGLNVAF